MSSCNYKIKFFDYSKKETVLFTCSEDSLSTGFCIFHDNEFNDEQEITKKLTDKINTDSKGPLFFIGYKIPKIKLSGTFSHPVYFTRSIIKNADFSGAKFQYADFSGAKFQYADFSGACFEFADFLAVKCDGKANFSKASFKNSVNFSESFFNEAIFTEATIKSGQFIGTNIRMADFALSKIEKSDFFGAIFGNVTFIGSKIIATQFSNARFQEKANFNGATLEKTDFSGTNFSGVDFDNSSLQVVSFRTNNFIGNATFSFSQLEKVNFYRPNFKKVTKFQTANLHEVIFSEGTFRDEVNFSRANFANVEFKMTEFHEADFTDAKFEGLTYFNDVTFKNQEKVFFRVDNLSKISFLRTDITKVWFDENASWGGKNGFRIVDEEFLKDSTKKTSLESIIATYRNIRKNYERRLRFEEADKFLEREIELKKIYHKNEKSSNVSSSEILTQKLADLTLENEKLKDKVDKYQDTLKEVLEIDSSSDKHQKFNADQTNLTKKKLYDELEKKLVWIFGTPRSGSTWLARDVLRREGIKFVKETLLGVHLGVFRDAPEIYWSLLHGNYNVKLSRIIDENKENFFFSSENELVRVA